MKINTMNTMMRRNLTLSLLIMLPFYTSSDTQGAEANSNRAGKKTMKAIKYGTPFGDKNSAAGEVFGFQDFRLRYLYFRDLNDAEKKLKDESNARGIDGGNSMLSPFNGFRVETRDGRTLNQFELSILPYAHEVFSVSGIQYELSNSDSEDSKWILNKKK